MPRRWRWAGAMAGRARVVALSNRAGVAGPVLADGRLAVLGPLAHTGRRGIRCIHSTRPGSSIGVKRGRGKATVRSPGTRKDIHSPPAWRTARFAKSASGFHPMRSFRASLPQICLQGLGLDPFSKISLWVARQRTAPAMTRSAPRRASVQSFANRDGGGHDSLRPVSCEKRPSRIEQRTSARASKATTALGPFLTDAGLNIE